MDEHDAFVAQATEKRIAALEARCADLELKNEQLDACLHDVCRECLSSLMTDGKFLDFVREWRIPPNELYAAEELFEAFCNLPVEALDEIPVKPGQSWAVFGEALENQSKTVLVSADPIDAANYDENRESLVADATYGSPIEPREDVWTKFVQAVNEEAEKGEA